MNKERDYLDEAVKKEYKKYNPKGLELRAKPFLNKIIPKNPNRLLVVGVALGGLEEIEALNKYFPEYEIYGIDIAESALKQKAKAKLVHCDVASIDFDKDYFSGVMCSAVLHETYSYSKGEGNKKVMKAIAEISRVLASGGIGVIREFFVPKDYPCKLICKSKEAEEFSRLFISKFRKNFDKKIGKKFVIRGSEIFSSRRLLLELLLHFRVTKVHFNSSIERFLKSKEIEEEYLPLSKKEYKEAIMSNGLKIIGIEYIDFPRYYSLIEENFKMTDLRNKVIKNKFGFVDITFRKK